LTILIRHLNFNQKINKESPKVNPDQAFESGGYREDNEDMPF